MKPNIQIAEFLQFDRFPQISRENDMLREEIRVAREAAEITASLVVKQFEETEKILRRFQVANAQRKAVLNSATRIAIIATDIRGIIQVFNTGAENLLGYRASEVIKTETPALFLLDSELVRHSRKLSEATGRRITGVTDILLEYGVRNSAEQMEWTHVRKNGSYFPVNMSVNGLRRHDGALSGILLIADDISDRKQAEAALRKARDELEIQVEKRTGQLAKANRELQTEIRERQIAEEALRASEKKYRSIFENATEGIFQTTPDGQLVTANPAMVRIMGYDSEEEMIRLVTNIRDQFYVNPEKREELSETMLRDGYVKNFETRFYRKDGGIIHISLSGHLVRDEHGRPIQYEGILEDITRRKRTEELKIAKEAAEAATRAKSDFLANMSHEIRTPMNAVIGLTELALKTDLSPRQQDYLDKIQISANSLLGIINDILDFSKIEAGRLELEHAEFRLGDVLKNLTDLFTDKVSQKGIELIISVADGVPTHLVGDSLRLSQLLINLTNNAMKFTDRGEVVIRVALITRKEDRVRLRFEVADSGIGIDRAVLPTLFSSFSQADSSTTRRYGGTGLGLAICKQLVELMGGEIGVESESDKGSTFYFTAELGVWEPQQPGADRPSPEWVRDLKVLVVDNNETSRVVYTEVLAPFAGHIASCGSGEAALRELAAAADTEHPFHLVLMDWRMPGMDGITTLEKIRETEGLSHLPVIIMTAFGREAVRHRAGEASADAFLIKPVKPSLLFDTILGIFGPGNGPENGRKKRSSSDSCVYVEKIQGSRLLLVEDNLINQQVTTEMLQSAGVIVDTADNGLDALRAIQAARYDGLLMDIQMPEMDGYEATRIIRNDPQFKDLPIIAMTAHALKGDMGKCIEAGMNDYVTKPVQSERLFAALARWVTPSVSLDLPAVTAEDPAEEVDFPNRLPGIDLPAALTRIKRKGLFRKLLLEFVDRHSDTAREIRTALNTGHPDHALRLVHNLKGVAGNFSATQLYTAALALESALRKGDTEAASTRLPAFEAALDRVLKGANRLRETAESETREAAEPIPSEKDADLSEIAGLSAKLARLLEDHDFAAEEVFEKLRKRLMQSTARDLTADLAAHINTLDFEGGLGVLKQIAHRLHVSLNLNGNG